MPNEVQLRPYDAKTDEPVLYSTFLNSYIRGALKNRPLSSMIKNVDRRVFFEYYTKEMDQIIADPATTILIACWKQEPTEIFGYAIELDNQLIYIYIKEAYHDKGVEKLLLEQLFDSEPFIKYASAGCVRCVKNVFEDRETS